jgi:flagellar protein FliO/FliZ
MAEIIGWIAILAVVAVLGVTGAVVARAYMSGTTPGALLFKPRPEPRVEVIEQANMDGRRKLVLIRRDDVEHLIMIGGPVDVVIETGIGEKPARAVELQRDPAATATVFTRAPRGLGQTATGEGS